jgi:hypothetical protein
LSWEREDKKRLLSEESSRENKNKMIVANVPVSTSDGDVLPERVQQVQQEGLLMAQEQLLPRQVGYLR